MIRATDGTTPWWMRQPAELGLAAVATMFVCACSGQAGVTSPNITCPDGTERLRVECDAIGNLKAHVMQANVGLPKLGFGISASYQEEAIKDISAETQQLATQLDGQCAKYNACAIDADTWLATEARLRKHVENVAALKANTTASTGMAVWNNAVPEKAAQGVTMLYQVMARPKGAANFGVHHSGQKLASGDEIRFLFRVQQETYVYILLSPDDGIPTQIFPLAGINVVNPVPANTTVAIPQLTKAFRLDEQTGTENFQIIASAQPLKDLETRLAQLRKSGNTAAPIDLQKEICAVATRGVGLVDTPDVGCSGVRHRGVVLGDAAAEQAIAPVAVQSFPYDSVIVIEHQIDHVAPGAAPTGSSPGSRGVRTRGMIVGEDGFIVGEDG